MSVQNYLVLLALFFGLTVGKSQKAVLFSNFNGEGDNFVISNSSYVADLSTVDFGNTAYSTCVTGIWIFYSNPDFNPNGTGTVEYIFGRDNYCVNLKTIGGRVSSLRFAGYPNDYYVDSLTIYQHTYFQGKEEYVYHQLDNLDILSSGHQSIIITGNCDWTVFDRPNFQGTAICLRIPKIPEHNISTPAFVPDLQSNEGGMIPCGTIQSVRKGCSDDSLEVKLTLLGIDLLDGSQINAVSVK